MLFRRKIEVPPLGVIDKIFRLAGLPVDFEVRNCEYRKSLAPPLYTFEVFPVGSGHYDYTLPPVTHVRFCLDTKLALTEILSIRTFYPYQRQGFGRLFVDGVENFASATGCKRVFLAPQKTSHGFWEHMKYKLDENEQFFEKLII